MPRTAGKCLVYWWRFKYLCIELAKALGFAVPSVNIIKTDNLKALAVERFDRRWTKDRAGLLRLPQEDICQVFGMPSSIKYESQGGPGIAQIMKLLMGSSNALEDQYNFMRFQVFQWIIGATDGHAKNFSIYIDRGGSYRLTPFYDILSAYPLLGGKGLNIRQLKLAMGLKATKGKKYEINKILPRHFLDTAKAVNFSQDKMQRIMDEMKGALPEAISQVRANLPEGFPEHISDSIFENANKIIKKSSYKILILNAISISGCGLISFLSKIFITRANLKGCRSILFSSR
ncbi:HipA domain-containing protein [Shewanella sp. JL219SE-S6]